MNKLPFAEKLPYWKTSRSSPDQWLERTLKVLVGLKASSISHAFCQGPSGGAFVIQFTHTDQSYRVTWPILPTQKPEDLSAAKAQAATMLYHDCKSKALAASVLGVQTAFIGALLIENNKTVSEVSAPQITQSMRSLALLSGKESK